MLILTSLIVAARFWDEISFATGLWVDQMIAGKLSIELMISIRFNVELK